MVLALLWPWRARRFLLRLWLAAAGALTWFLVSTPLTLHRMAWVHRRWLAGVAAGLLVAAVLASVAVLARRLRHGGAT